MASKYIIITPQELEAAQRTLGLKPGEMAKRLKTPKRTYQDWLAGKRPISGACDTAVELLLREDARFMARVRGQEAPDGPQVLDLAMMVKDALPSAAQGRTAPPAAAEVHGLPDTPQPPGHTAPAQTC